MEQKDNKKTGISILCLLLSAFLFASGVGSERVSAHPVQGAKTKPPEKKNKILKTEELVLTEITLPHMKFIQSSDLSVDNLALARAIRYTGDGTLTLNGLLLRVHGVEVLVDRNYPDGRARIMFTPAALLNAPMNMSAVRSQHKSASPMPGTKANTPNKNPTLKPENSVQVELTLPQVKSFTLSGSFRLDYQEDAKSIRYTGDGALSLESGLQFRVRQAQVLIDRSNPDGSARITIVPAPIRKEPVKQP